MAEGYINGCTRSTEHVAFLFETLRNHLLKEKGHTVADLVCAPTKNKHVIGLKFKIKCSCGKFIIGGCVVPVLEKYD